MFVLNYLKKILHKLFSKRNHRLFPQGNSIKISKDLVLGKNININIPNPEVNIQIGPNVIFNEFCNVLIFKNGSLKIGTGVFFNNYCSINCLHLITIGNNTIVGESVKIYDHNHAYQKKPVIAIQPGQYTLGAVTIGNNCWIGSNVTILKGVTIGDNVIIGANCLIYESIPSNSIVKADISLQINTF